MKYSPIEIPRIVQGSLLENVIEYRPRSILGEETEFDKVVHPVVIVVSQDCDLEQDFNMRGEVKSDHRRLHSVLLCDVHPSSEIRSANNIASDIFRRVKSNSDPRYHFFEKLLFENFAPDPKLSIASLFSEPFIVDFKVYFTVATEILYESIESGTTLKSYKINSPYLEDFIQRYTSYLGRVPLPEPHRPD